MSSIFPLATPTIKSLIGIPASANATAAAVIPTHRVPASAARISISTRIFERGNLSTRTTLSSASAVTLLISLERRLKPGRILSLVENGAMLYLTSITALSCLCILRGCASIGP